jgi:hypothetical protein
VRHPFELSEGARQPSWKPGNISVYGCGLVLDQEDKLAIFFTLNGKLRGEILGIKKKNFHLINFNINHD